MRKKIGVIDSGVGGLSLVRCLDEAKLNLDCYYVCDHKNVPYGGKEQSFMYERSKMMVSRLLEKKITSLLLACNTLTVETIDLLRKEFPSVTFVGIEPFINYLNHPTHSGEHRVILVLTKATFKSQKFQALRQLKDRDSLIKVIALNQLALLIEKYIVSGDFPEAQIKKELEIVSKENPQTLILGCTHYPLIASFLASHLNCKVIDPHQQVIKHMKEVFSLEEADGLNHLYFCQDLTQDWSSKSLNDLLPKTLC